MKTGRYNLKELLTHNEIEQIIIPEIQRDYVWAESNVKKLIDDILKNYDKKESHPLEIKINGVAESSESVQQFLKKEYERLKYHQKLGFIYAYHDRDYAGKFFLIDGQQRITTLFLMLLYLYKATNQEKAFRTLYFDQGLPKVDYKVREQSHDFLKLLLESELSNTNYKESEHYYASEYQKDITIRHLIQNYEFIKKHLNNLTDKNSFLEYLEDFVEVNYFDTHLSEQGELLYIYMNSRGEQLSFQEMVRAALMQKNAEPAKKIELGNAWENWQNFFWRYRVGNENADKGFEVFLKWAAILHMESNVQVDLENFIDPSQKIAPKELKLNYIKQFPEGSSKKNQQEALFNYYIKYLDFDFLNELFIALEWTYTNASKYIPVEPKWLSGDMKVLDYIVLLPLLQYQMQNKWTNNAERILFAERVTMFLKNITDFESVSKSPDSATLNALHLVSPLEGDKKDILFITETNPSKSILTTSECLKLERLSKAGTERRKWEAFIWDVTLNDKLNSFLMGDISVLIKCLDKEKEADGNVDTFEILEAYLKILKEVVFKNKDKDELRRLILAHFDYTLLKGSGKGKDKYSFIKSGDSEELGDWAKTMDKNEFIELLQWINKQSSRDIDKLLEFAITTFQPNGWREAFVKCPELLEYCRDKKILWNDGIDILLLKETNYNDKTDGKYTIKVQYALLKQSFTTSKMRIFKNKCCVLDFDFDKDTKELIFKEDNKGFALDFIYNQNKWVFTLFHREQKITDFIKLKDDTKWEISKENENRLTFVNETIHAYDATKSLLENNEVIATKVNALLDDVEQLLAQSKW